MARARTLTLALLLLLPPGGSWLGATARGVAGGVAGLATGIGVAVGLVVARARFEHRYVESVHELYGVDGLPIVLGVAAGVVVGIAGGPELGASVLGTIVGGAAGAGVGAAVGGASGAGPEAPWAWGILLGAVGMLLGAILGFLLARRRRRSGRSGPAAVRTAALLALLVVVPAAALIACGGGESTAAGGGSSQAEPVPPNPAPARAVVFLAGDPGEARFDRYPVLPRMAGDIADWARRVPAGGEVVLMLGDIVYPTGMAAPGSAGYEQDSARVTDQVRLVSRPLVARSGARMFFLPGNHDWGLREDQAGAKRLRNLGEFLDRARARGAPVELAPKAGTGGPQAVDVGDRLRLLLLDTAWWVFDAEPSGKAAFLKRFHEAVANAGDRTLVVAAHHPLKTGGPHGGLVSLWSSLGIQYLLNRSGALLQDLSSQPYVALRKGMTTALEHEGRPLLFVAGHDHSLQVFRDDSAGTPRYSVVSGSASKLTPVGAIQGTLFDASKPGYMRLVTRTDGSVDLFVEATDAAYRQCPDPAVDQQANVKCMREAMAAFQTVYSARLRDAGR